MDSELKKKLIIAGSIGVASIVFKFTQLLLAYS